MGSLTIQTFNMRGGRDFDKRLSVFRYLKNLMSDIYLLQETHALKSESKLWNDNWGMGKVFLNEGTNRSAGQAFLLKTSVEVLEHKIVVFGRIQLLKIKREGTIITIVNVYGPNVESDRGEFLDKL